MSDIAVHHSLTEYTQQQPLPTMTARGGSVFMPSRNPYLAKWDILFDKKIAEWISFKPQLGLQVYPCYACRDMFGSKNSFLDHVNRRGMLLKYKCSYCDESDVLVFYNPCSFLLHTRQHYTLLGGQINLESLEVSLLPFGLAGFLPDPSVPLLYQVEDDNVGETSFINTRFYSPVHESMGQPIVNLVPNELLFFFSPEPNAPSTSLVLKQISSNIPRCQFVVLDNNRFAPVPNGVDVTGKEISNSVQIKEEPQEQTNQSNCQYDMPIITKIETLDEPNNETQETSIPNSSNVNIPFNENIENFPRCPECKEVQVVPMGEHFLKTKTPFQDSLRCSICKYIAPTKCSLRAHERIHNSVAPYVCPECGKDFDDWESLHAHLEEVCFHLTKQVRMRCPGKKCGKIFAQIITFSAHFLLHMLCLNKCVVCNIVFASDFEFAEHNEMYDYNHGSIKIYKCTVCSDLDETFTSSTYQEHIHEHTTSRRQCLYVYICKRCHSYFRSTLTYATHLLRCNKPMPQTTSQFFIRRDTAMLTEVKRKRKGSIINVLGICIACKMQTKIEVHNYDSVPTNCSKCGNRLSYKKGIKKTEMEMMFESDSEITLNNTINTGKCLLCGQKMTINEIKDHFSKKKCKFQDPIVIIDSKIASASSSNSSSPKSDDSVKKKRRRISSKFRKLSTTNSETDMTIEPEEPIPFDGTYRCKLCDFSNTSREVFHEHIVKHRDVCTAYQCMECGECFVVKPSLAKHLLYFHQITEIEAYFDENNCFDKEAVKELENIMRLAPGETKEPVAENQCRVCLQQFNDTLELNKHFRIHGMAFLFKNSK
ncbi:hypothetical protein ILUMI_02315 [Ignelater luminosus]|uniref:C2H2-type domain-containing protein n=1 Tax=Ignelater luminosus TaxID=2038154 RepID=A0A8K0GLG4_IGNLU|nr:hypothetical protein ILUMI_02315 [Ignelater luminosus]